VKEPFEDAAGQIEMAIVGAAAWGFLAWITSGMARVGVVGTLLTYACPALIGYAVGQYFRTQKSDRHLAEAGRALAEAEALVSRS
jgi:hypothetical protein